MKKNTALVISYGETLETCFAQAANTMFSLIADISDVHTLQIITFDFEQADMHKALVTWLNTLIELAKVHRLMFGDFRLKRIGNKWSATVSGEPWREEHKKSLEIKKAEADSVAITKVNHIWEIRCVVSLTNF